MPLPEFFCCDESASTVPTARIVGVPVVVTAEVVSDLDSRVLPRTALFQDDNSPI